MNLSLAVAVINRNLPELADELVDGIAHLGDALYVVENGSDPDKRSKHANIVFEESNGVGYAVNHVIQRALDDGHDLVWVNYNDARFEDPAGYVSWSKRMFAANDKLAVTTGYWPALLDVDGFENPAHQPNAQCGHKRDQPCIVSFFDPLSFVVSTAAAKGIAAHDSRLTPFWDASNFTAHYVMLGPAQSLYSRGYFMAADPRHAVTERDLFRGEDKEELSLLARGYDDTSWKRHQGPKHIDAWMSKFFPEHADKPTNKEKRDAVILSICLLWHANRRGVVFV